VHLRNWCINIIIKVVFWLDVCHYAAVAVSFTYRCHATISALAASARAYHLPVGSSCLPLSAQHGTVLPHRPAPTGEQRWLPAASTLVVVGQARCFSHQTRDHRWPCVQFNCSSRVEQFANGSAVFWVTGHFSTPLENWTVRAFLQLTPHLSNDFTAAWLTFTFPQLFAVAATLKSIDYNVLWHSFLIIIISELILDIHRFSFNYTTDTHPVQTGSHSAQLSAVQGSWVPGWLLYTSLRHSQPTSLTVSHLTSPDRTTLPAQHFRSSGLLCRWSDGLELATGQSLWPGAQQQQFQTIAEDEPLASLLSKHSEVETPHDSALYKSIIDIDLWHLYIILNSCGVWLCW